MRIRTLFFIVAILSTSLLASAASGASITINSSGGSSYQVVGSGLSNVAALDVTIKYDPSIIESPKITPGTLARGSFVANPNTPGVIRIAFVTTSGVSGTGSLAEITFTRKGTSGGGITGITLNQILDPSGKALQVIAGLGNLSGSAMTAFPNADSSQIPGSGGTTTTIPGTQPSAAGGTAAIGTLTLPGESGSDKDNQRKDAAEIPVTPPAATPATEIARQEPVPENSPPVKKEKRPIPAAPADVLEIFRAYKGEPTLKSLKKLFTARGGEWIVQNPPVAPADGKTLITLQLATDIFNEKAPNFSLKGLEMKQIKTSDSGWAFEVIPAKDSLNSSISIVFDGSVVEVQVVTVPALPKSWDKVKLTEAEVNRFLAGKAPKGDLNGDGLHDYKDDYILVGNYLLQEKAN
jgi:hypothetical protein